MITMKDVVREGHPALRERAKDVSLPASEEEKETLEKNAHLPKKIAKTKKFVLNIIYVLV